MRLNRRKPRVRRLSSVEQLELRTVLTAPTITSNALVSLAENQTTVTTVTATDPEAPPETLTFAITGGDDAALFSINPTTGELTFLAAPDFEIPVDANTDNVYDVTVTVDDGNSGTDSQNLAITVTGLNDNAPIFTSPTSFSLSENTTAVGTVAATDDDLPAQSINYSITGGADEARFTINASTGALAFLVAPDFENPLDANTDNVYEVEVTADDGSGSTTVQTISVTVSNFPLSFTTPATATVAENSTAVLTVEATDSDTPPATITYSITGGADAALFTINPTTGDLTFTNPPDFENPLDAGANNVYNVEITADGGSGLTAVQSLAVTVTNLPLAFTSSNSVSIPENTTAVLTVVATDGDTPPATVTYSITGGVDAAQFGIDANTGALTFLAPPDYENPLDQGTDSVYHVEVTADDGTTTPITQALTVVVNAVNDNAPVFTNPAAYSVTENATAVGTVHANDADAPAQTVTYSITGGSDAALFTINPSTGALAFLAGPDFENPLDANTDNVYSVEVTANDGSGLTTSQAITVTVTNLPLAFTSPTTFSVAENTATVGTVTATDNDTPPTTVTYSITGGADAALFTINPSTGALAFLQAPDFETPLDANTDNVYLVQVTADDGQGHTPAQNLSITVTDLPPTFTSPTSFSTVENTTAVGTVAAVEGEQTGAAMTYSITGGADAALFSIDPSTGVLAFLATPDFENPTDAGANNVYNITVTAAATGGASATQNIAVTVTGVNDNAPVFTSSNTFNAPENGTAVGAVVATDADLPAQTLSYSITGGADAALFAINPTTGVLTFLTAPDAETPADANTDNVYEVQVTADDGSGSTTSQSINVSVTTVNEFAPEFVTFADFTIEENLTDVGTVTATDADLPAQTITYSITGGVDADLFDIDPQTGALTFVDAPDFETPLDDNGDNVYDIQVTANDNAGKTTVQNITVTVTNDVEPPVITLSDVTATYYLHKDHALVSPTATFIADATAEENYDGARLVVSITDNRDRRDTLNIYSKGKTKVKQHRVLYKGEVIGHVHGGKNHREELVVTFNSRATTAAIEQVVKHINFNADGKNSIGDTRTVTMQFYTPAGDLAAESSRDIDVLPPVS